jgi:Spy/CpxP family protein refolding chaperone
MNPTLKALVLAIAIATPASVFAATPDTATRTADHSEHHRGFRVFKKIEANSKELGIAPATLEQMKAAFQAARPDFQRLRQDLEQARQSGDQARIASAQTAMRDRRHALRTQIDSLLTDQQRAAIKQMMEHHRAEHGQKTDG